MTWLIQHHTDLFEAIAAVHLAAVAIANLTPTPKDDEVIAKIYRAIEILAGIVSPKAKM